MTKNISISITGNSKISLSLAKALSDKFIIKHENKLDINNFNNFNNKNNKNIDSNKRYSHYLLLNRKNKKDKY